MKYRNIIVLAGLYFALTLSSCTDWLQVERIDKYTESQVFESEYNIQQALNGIYIGMGQNSLYGLDMTTVTSELLAQEYATGGASSSSTASFEILKYNLLNYTYTSEKVKDKFLSIWTAAYKSILNTNNFIDKLEKTEGVISASNKDLLLGEAYGIRAYLHLDMLRLFGPVYLTDSTGIAVPYHKDPKIEYSEQISANKVMDNIVADLDIALELLKNDPVITEGPMAAIEDSLTTSQKRIDKFYRYRNRRMNYYAAGTLKVRALMYRNDKQSAADLALKLLVVDDKFPWTQYKDFYATDKEDRVFSSEVLFGVHSSNMYSNWTTYCSPTQTTTISLTASLVSNMEKLFEANTNELPYSRDYRSKNWLPFPADNANYLINYKFSKSSKETDFWYFQPLIRKTELYYTLAECLEDVSWLNTVRLRRNIDIVENVRPAYILGDEILREFRKEMINEGQIFFFYKRKNYGSIQNGSSEGTVSMNSVKYKVSLPQSELDR